jgi:hypothetical protein
MLGPTVSRSVYLGAKYPSGTQDQIYITVRQLRVISSPTRAQVCRLQ